LVFNPRRQATRRRHLLALFYCHLRPFHRRPLHPLRAPFPAIPFF
jgi:hypothetical protein